MILSVKHRFIDFFLKLADQPAVVFMILALAFGGWFIFKLPPLSGTDEFTHFPRVYQISMGTFWEQKLPGHEFGGLLPVNINNMINDYRNLSRFPTGSSYLSGAAKLAGKYSKLSNPGKKLVPAAFTSDVIYPPWAFFPSLIGLSIAKAIKLPLIWYVYLARISNYLVWVVLAFLAIKFIPSGKWFMVALALLPTSVSQAATIGGDGILMGLSWLLIALTLTIVAKKLKPEWPVLLACLGISVCVAAIKDGYFLLGLVPLVVPIETFAKKSWGYIWKASTLAAVLAVAALFTLRTVHAVGSTVLTPTAGLNINAHKQIHYMLTHLPTYIGRVIMQPFNKAFDTTYQGIVGIITNRLIYLSLLVMALLAFNLYLGMRAAPRVERLVRYRKRLIVVFGAIFILSYGLIASAQYIGETSVGAAYVSSMYGRYFLPLLPLLLVFPLTLKNRQTLQSLILKASISVISLIGLVAMCLSIQ